MLLKSSAKEFIKCSGVLFSTPGLSSGIILYAGPAS
jgi:hypothetical protein